MSHPSSPGRVMLSRGTAVGTLTASAIAALVAAAVAVQAPRTRRHEGEVLHAYRDPARVATICSGRTIGVRPGDTATPAQCAAWLREDLAVYTAVALRAVPTLAEQPAALRQAGDFAFNAGDARFARSPMAAAFRARRWRRGCEAFRGYVTLYRAPAGAAGHHCRIGGGGIRYCEAAGLVARREDERAQCLAGLVD